MHDIQLFRERLSYKRGKAYATMPQVIMGNGGFYGCLSEPEGVPAWWKETAQTHVFVLSRSLLLNHLETQSIKTKLLLPIMPIGIVVYAFTLFVGQPLSKQLYTPRAILLRLWRDKNRIELPRQKLPK